MVKAAMVLAAYMAALIVVPQVQEMQVRVATRQTPVLSQKHHDMAVAAQVLLLLDHMGQYALFGLVTLDHFHLLV